MSVLLVRRRHRTRIAPAAVSRFNSLLFAEADDADLQVRKDGWGNHATIYYTRFFFRERVVRREIPPS
jgi:hypothetical protein